MVWKNITNWYLLSNSGNVENFFSFYLFIAILYFGLVHSEHVLFVL